jgi:hypothetical protein
VYVIIADLRATILAQPNGTPLTDEGRKQAEALRKQLDAMPEKQRKSVELLAGAHLADLEPTQTEVSRFVTTYRKEVERRALNSLSAPRPEDLGRPKVFGTTDLTKGSLDGIKDVQEIMVNGQRYHKAWAGSSLVLVPQAKDAPHPQSNDPPIKKLGLHQDVHNVLNKAHSGHVVIKSFHNSK